MIIKGIHDMGEYFIEDEIFQDKKDEADLNKKLENEMIFQRRYDVALWKNIYFSNDFMKKVSQKIIWSLYYKEEFLYTFNIDNNMEFLRDDNITYKTITNYEEGKSFDDYNIRILHPINCHDKQLVFWKNIFKKERLIQPFAQLDRKVFLMDEEDEILGYVTRFEDLSISKKNVGSRMRVYDWFSTFLGDNNRYEYYKEYCNTGAECEFECFDLERDEVNFHKIKFYKMENVAKDGGECYCFNKNYYINPKEVDNIIFSEILYDIYNVLNQN